MKKEKHGNSMFLNKDGYAKSVEIEVPDQNLEIDPRGKSSFRGKGVYIATGDVADVEGQLKKNSSGVLAQLASSANTARVIR